MFPKYPKRRPALPPKYQRIYHDHYRENRDGKSFATKYSTRLENWMHLQVSEDVVRQGHGGATLEIGAGTLNHLDYEPRTSPYDIVEPYKELFEGREQVGRIRAIYRDISEIPPDRRYERIISIATLEHVLDLPRVVAMAGLLMQPQGQFRAGIPSEGGLLWGLGWRLTTGVEFRIRRGLDYGVMLRHEHINTANEIEAVLAYFFARVESRALGLGPSLSFYRSFACSGVRVERCTGFLDDGQHLSED